MHSHIHLKSLEITPVEFEIPTQDRPSDLQAYVSMCRCPCKPMSCRMNSESFRTEHSSVCDIQNDVCQPQTADDQFFQDTTQHVLAVCLCASVLE
jgi:hypothetical protein